MRQQRGGVFWHGECSRERSTAVAPPWHPTYHICVLPCVNLFYTQAEAKLNSSEQEKTELEENQAALQTAQREAEVSRRWGGRSFLGYCTAVYGALCGASARPRLAPDGAGGSLCLQWYKRSWRKVRRRCRRRKTYNVADGTEGGGGKQAVGGRSFRAYCYFTGLYVEIARALAPNGGGEQCIRSNTGGVGGKSGGVADSTERRGSRKQAEHFPLQYAQFFLVLYSSVLLL